LILLDTNLLIYAHVQSAPQHRRARQWLDAQLNGTARVGMPWPSLLGFLRIVTNPRVFPKAEPIHDAWGQVEAWLKCPVVWIPQPAVDHPEILREMLRFATSSQLVPDAHLAALAVEHGLTLCSTDGDFARFQRLSWNNPLAE
jgi:toxin-antitoxin system PIN domain toxin